MRASVQPLGRALGVVECARRQWRSAGARGVGDRVRHEGLHIALEKRPDRIARACSASGIPKGTYPNIGSWPIFHFCLAPVGHLGPGRGEWQVGMGVVRSGVVSGLVEERGVVWWSLRGCVVASCLRGDDGRGRLEV